MSDWERMKSEQEKRDMDVLRNNFTRYQLCVLAAHARRFIPGTPDYHPTKASRIYCRYSDLIRRATELISK